MTGETNGYEEPILTRREALKGGSAAAVAAGTYLLQEQLVQAATAQTQEPRIQLGQDWTVDDDPDGNGHFVITHQPSGNSYALRNDGTLTSTTVLVGDDDKAYRLGTERSASDVTLIPDDTAVGSLNLHPGQANDRAHYLVCNDPDADNFGFIKYELSGTHGMIRAAQKGTGTAPTSLEFSGFADGITIEDTIIAQEPNATAPNKLYQFGTGVGATALETAATTVTADNTSQLIHSPGDPPFMGLVVVTGIRTGSRFSDLLMQVRNDTVAPVQKTDGAGPPGARSYSLNGSDLEVAIDESGDTYAVTTTFIGGGT